MGLRAFTTKARPRNSADSNALTASSAATVSSKCTMTRRESPRGLTRMACGDIEGLKGYTRACNASIGVPERTFSMTMLDEDTVIGVID